MEEIFKQVFIAKFLDIAQELQEYSNQSNELEPDIPSQLEWKGNQIEVYSSIRNFWSEEVDYGEIDVDPPIPLGCLGVLENLNYGDSSSKYTEIRILSPTPSSFWPGFISVLRRKFLPLKDDSEPDKPWLRIPDHLWDREAVRLWWDLHTAQEIALTLGNEGKANVKPRRITNRLSELRQHYPDEVPTNQERRRKFISRGKS